MKNLFTVIFCMTLCMLVLGACGKQQTDIESATDAPAATVAPETPAPTATPVPASTPVQTLVPTTVTPPAPVAMSANLPKITKNPTDETVPINGKCQFVTRYENADLAEWHFISPDGYRDLTYADAEKEFPTLKIINGYAKDMTLDSIPAALNGWRVYCRFSNNAGSADSGSALITVQGAKTS